MLGTMISDRTHSHTNATSRSDGAPDVLAPDVLAALLEHISDLRPLEIDQLEWKRKKQTSTARDPLKSGGGISDQELALALFAAEAESLLNIKKDRGAGGISADELLEELTQVEETARYDRAFAIALAEGRDPPTPPARLGRMGHMALSRRIESPSPKLRLSRKGKEKASEGLHEESVELRTGEEPWNIRASYGSRSITEKAACEPPQAESAIPPGTRGYSIRMPREGSQVPSVRTVEREPSPLHLAGVPFRSSLGQRLHAGRNALERTIPDEVTGQPPPNDSGMRRAVQARPPWIHPPLLSTCEVVGPVQAVASARCASPQEAERNVSPRSALPSAALEMSVRSVTPAREEFERSKAPSQASPHGSASKNTPPTPLARDLGAAASAHLERSAPRESVTSPAPLDDPGETPAGRTAEWVAALESPTRSEAGLWVTPSRERDQPMYGLWRRGSVRPPFRPASRSSAVEHVDILAMKPVVSELESRRYSHSRSRASIASEMGERVRVGSPVERAYCEQEPMPGEDVREMSPFPEISEVQRSSCANGGFSGAREEPAELKPEHAREEYVPYCSSEAETPASERSFGAAYRLPNPAPPTAPSMSYMPSVASSPRYAPATAPIMSSGALVASPGPSLVSSGRVLASPRPSPARPTRAPILPVPPSVSPGPYRLAHASFDTCAICGDDISGTTVVRLRCGHTYDVECINKLFTQATVDESLFPPTCCNTRIVLADVERYLGAALQDRFRDKEREFGTSNRVYCCNRRCSVFLCAATAGSVSGVSTYCSACGSRTCTTCKEYAHPGSSCRPLATSDDAVLKLGETKGWKRCPSCRHLVSVEEGCYHVKCRCGKEFCYRCGRMWKGCHCDLFYVPPEEGSEDGVEMAVETAVADERLHPAPVPTAPLGPAPRVHGAIRAWHVGTAASASSPAPMSWA